MIKIIFFTIDGIGLGHIVRGINIAKELRKMIACEILFVTNSPFLELFKEENFNFLRGGADPIEWCDHKISYEDYLRINEKFLLSAITRFCPNIVIFDFLIMPEVIQYVKNKNIFSVYILREVNTFDFFVPLKPYLSFFDLVLLTGIENKDFKKNAVSVGFDKDKVFYVGNIFRKPDRHRIPSVKKKYNKKTDEFLITVTVGGGGVGRDFLSEIRKFILTILVIAKKIKSSKKLRWLFIKGPLFPEEINASGPIEIVDYEKHLPDLFHISDLIVATGGYNTVNEILATKRPSLIYPLIHKEKFIESQTMRISFYDSKGFIKLIDINDFNKTMDLFRNVLRPNVLETMKHAYKNYRHRNGNRLAASLIKNNFLKYSKFLKNRIKIGILREKIDMVTR